MAPTAFVRALRDGVYNDPEHRAQQVKAGTFLTVAGGWYVAYLIEQGLVEPADEVQVRAYFRGIETPEARRERIEQINESGVVLREWHEGANMEGVGPHVQAQLDSKPKPAIDITSLVEMANELHDLDAALALADAPSEMKQEEQSAKATRKRNGGYRR